MKVYLRPRKLSLRECMKTTFEIQLLPTISRASGEKRSAAENSFSTVVLTRKQLKYFYQMFSVTVLTVFVSNVEL